MKNLLRQRLKITNFSHTIFLMDVNVFDFWILHFLNSFSGKFHAIDLLACGFEREEFLKGGAITACLWLVWYKYALLRQKLEVRFYAGILGALAAIVIARLIALLAPFRLRPIYEAQLHFVAPFGMNPDSLIKWSSFPSDHAALYAGLVFTMYSIHRKTGILMAMYTAVLLLARVYTGDHYPTDILSGALIGVLVVALAQRIPLLYKWYPEIRSKAIQHPALTAFSLYTVSFEIATNMDFIRHVAIALYRLMKRA